MINYLKYYRYSYVNLPCKIQDALVYSGEHCQETDDIFRCCRTYRFYGVELCSIDVVVSLCKIHFHHLNGVKWLCKIHFHYLNYVESACTIHFLPSTDSKTLFDENNN